MEHIEPKRVEVHFDSHFGLGIRWDNWDYQLRLLFELPFFSIGIGIGKRV